MKRALDEALDERREAAEAIRRRRQHYGAAAARVPCLVPWCERCGHEDDWHYVDDSPVLDALFDAKRRATK